MDYIFQEEVVDVHGIHLDLRTSLVFKIKMNINISVTHKTV